jgi:hypothetical protein
MGLAGRRVAATILTTLLLLLVIAGFWLGGHWVQRQVISIPLSGFLRAVAIVSILILVWLPKFQTRRLPIENADRFNAENEARKTLAQILGGLALIGGVYTATETLRVGQEQVRILNEQADVAQKQLRLAEEGQITERFTRAIAQLGDTDAQGSKRLAVRLGGIYALERIADDSPREHRPIMDVLTAYVREHSPRKRDMPPMGAPSISADIQAILTVIGRRSTPQPGPHLDLADTDLTGARLYGDFRDLNLQGATLARAVCTGAKLRGAFIPGVDLTSTSCVEADMSNANIRKGTLRGAQLSRANLSGWRQSHRGRSFLRRSD